MRPSSGSDAYSALEVAVRIHDTPGRETGQVLLVPGTVDTCVLLPAGEGNAQFQLEVNENEMQLPREFSFSPSKRSVRSP